MVILKINKNWFQTITITLNRKTMINSKSNRREQMNL